MENESETEIAESENEEGIVTIGKITYKEKDEIGRSLAIVYRGRFNKEKVAVKKIQMIDPTLETSEDRLKELESPYVVRLLHVENREGYRYTFIIL